MIQYTEDWILLLVFKRKGSVALKSLFTAIPVGIFSFFLVLMDDISPTFRTDFGLLTLTKSQLWSGTTAILVMMLAFRTNRAMARFWEGTGLLHQMRGEWFDSISCCVTFSHLAMALKRDDVLAFRHTLVRLMSLCHGSALEEIAGQSGEEVDCIDPWGLDNETLNHLNECKRKYHFNRVEVLLHMTQTLITKALDDGIVQIPPPILSRVYQTLSRGFVNLLNAKKIADTRFPFPYAQLIAILLCGHTLLTPLLISCLVPSKIWAPIFTMVPICAMFAINSIGIELENPFGSDENDLPLHHFQGEMNKCLMMLLHDSADLIPGVHPVRCIRDFYPLASTVHGGAIGEAADEACWEQPSSKNMRLSNWPGPGEDGKSPWRRQHSRLPQERLEDTDDGLRATHFSAGLVRESIPEEQESHMEAKSEAKAIFLPSSMLTKEQLQEQNLEDSKSATGADAFVRPSQAKALEGCADEGKRLQTELTMETMASFSHSLPELRELVERQVLELAKSINALKDFCSSLPLVIDSMISHRQDGEIPVPHADANNLFWSGEAARANPQAMLVLPSSLTENAPTTPVGTAQGLRPVADPSSSACCRCSSR